MARTSITCPHCNKVGFGSNAAMTAHIKSKHPGTDPADKTPYQNVTLKFPKNLEPGLHGLACPFCHQPTRVFIKDDGTVASSSEIPKPPASSDENKDRLPVKRAAHPVVIKNRFQMRLRPDGTFKNTIAMMGTHGKTAPEMPWNEVGVSERWLLNDSHSIRPVKPHVEAGKVDRWFQLHHRWRFTRRVTRHSDDHWQWLQDQDNVARVFMQRKFADVPRSEPFKIREISEMFIGDKLGRGAGYVQVYYTNTFSYMFAQAAYEKVTGVKDWERIELYGCELEQLETEYFRQRPGLEFWFGLCVNLGIEIYVPELCFMLYAQDVVNTSGTQQMVQYPGYMAYGFKSPSMEEAKSRKEPLGMDVVEENVIGAWDGYVPDHTFALNEGLAFLARAHDMSKFGEDNDKLNAWMDEWSRDTVSPSTITE